MESEKNMDYDISEIYSEVGKRYGYETVTAEFAEFDELKLKWVRHGSWARFFVSDYLGSAPKNVAESIAETLMKKICSVEGSDYSGEVCGWLTSDGFVEENQPVYISRKEGMVPPEEGKKKDLAASYARLVSAGFLAYDPKVYIGWDYGYTEPGPGRSSVLMKVAGASPKLDSDVISDEAFDYAVYSLLLHVFLGFVPCRKRESREFEEKLSQYPRRDELSEELAGIGVTV